MKRKSNLIITPLLLVSLMSCGKGPSTKENESRTPFTLLKKDENKVTFIGKEGVPFLMKSAVLRTDLFINADHYEVSNLDEYFALAKETGLSTLEIPFMWKEIETDYDQYNYEDLENYLSFAKKYDLKINLLWYGSFTDGESHTNNFPSYIYENKSTYPLIQYCYPSSVFGDCVIMDWSNTNLLNREYKALKTAMDYVYEWNLNNENYDPILMVQLGAGLDRLDRWRINQYEIKVNGEIMSSDTAWSLVSTYASKMGNAVKDSKYKALTRVEFCEQQAVTNYVRNIYELSSVDIVNTSYLHTVAQTKTGIKNFDDEFGEEIPIINTENWSNDDNHKIALATYAFGGSGFASYHLSSPLYYPLENNQGVLYRRRNDDATTLEERFLDINSRASKLKEVNSLLDKGYVAVAKAKKNSFGLFGFDNLLSKGETSKQYMNNGIMFEYNTDDENKLGYCIYLNNYLYVISNVDASFKLVNSVAQIASTGKFNSSSMWEKESDIEINKEQTFNLNANELYRIRISNIDELPSYDELSKQGYKTINDAIRG